MGSQDDLEREAERAVQEKRYWDAEQILIGLEATASPFVFRTLGWMNEMGVSSSPSIERAIDYYKSAIDVGSKRALADLGVALSKASKDAEAIPILRKVSMEGNLSALYHLSCALLRQEDARSRREGMELLKEASDRGHLIALNIETGHPFKNCHRIFGRDLLYLQKFLNCISEIVIQIIFTNIILRSITWCQTAPIPMPTISRTAWCRRWCPRRAEARARSCCNMVPWGGSGAARPTCPAMRSPTISMIVTHAPRVFLIALVFRGVGMLLLSREHRTAFLRICGI